MNCLQLMKGHDIECLEYFNKYYQNIVLVNRDDLESFKILADGENNRITFKLKPGKTGYLFRGSEKASSLRASFSRTEKNNRAYYKHLCQIPVVGVKEDTKTLLRQLDNSNCFSAIQFKDGTVEIFGFNYGLKTSPYTFEAQGFGGAEVQMESKYEELDPPYVYFVSSKAEDIGGLDTPENHFNNLFANLPEVYGGDFNNDFNNDFYVD